MVAEKSRVWRGGWHCAKNAPDIGQESHIEHPVGFIEHQDFNRIQVGCPLPHQVQQATRAGNGNLGAGAQALNLRLRADATVNGQAAQSGLATESANGGVGLLSQLAGGRKNEGAQLTARPFQQVLQDGQDKSSRLPGAGLGQA